MCNSLVNNSNYANIFCITNILYIYMNVLIQEKHSLFENQLFKQQNIEIKIKIFFKQNKKNIYTLFIKQLI